MRKLNLHREGPVVEPGPARKKLDQALGWWIERKVLETFPGSSTYLKVSLMNNLVLATPLLDVETVQIYLFAAQLADELDDAETKLLFSRFEKGRCGHSERYLYTEDGGKHIICLLCDRAPSPRSPQPPQPA